MSVLQLLWQSWQAFRMGKAAREGIADDVCVACDSTNVSFPAERAYECLDCGYRGGPGWAEMKAKRETDALDKLSDEERRLRAVKCLKEARTLVLSAQGTLGAARSSNTMDALGMGTGAIGSGDGSAAQQELVSAMGDLLHAEREMEIASHCVRRDLPANVRLSVELGFAGAAMDQWSDGIIGDMYTRTKIQSAARHCDVMLNWIENAIQKVASGAV